MLRFFRTPADRVDVQDRICAAGSPFDVVEPVAILRILETLARRRSLLIVHARGSDATFVTQVLHAEAGAVILDRPSLAEHDALLLAAPAARLEGRDHDVPVAFAIATPVACAFGGRPALSVPLPAVVQRFQRRDHYRVHVPRARPTFCDVPLPGGDARVRARVVDLSCSGLSLAADDPALRAWPEGERRGPCELRLPGQEALAVHLAAVRAIPAHGRPARSLACRFVGLDGRAHQVVQRYVDALQRDVLRRR
jgi:c-di-GMP-binding flagellar brake protein YcgR